MVLPVRWYHPPAAPSKMDADAASNLLSPISSPKETWPEFSDNATAGDPTKRAFNYFVLAGARFIGAASARSD